jgi:hypothetical protein
MIALQSPNHGHGLAVCIYTFVSSDRAYAILQGGPEVPQNLEFRHRLDTPAIHLSIM